MPLPPDLHIVDDPAVPVAELLAEQARRGGSIVLTGGSSPAPAYARAAALEPDWSKVTLWWGDDRCVPPEHEWSNYRLAKETLLDHLEEQPREVHRIRGELSPAEAADELDDEVHRATSGPPGLEPWVERVTMTMPEIRTAKRIVFIVDGPSKAEAVARAFGGNISPAAPASLVLLAPISVEVFLDESAAAKLRGG